MHLHKGIAALPASEGQPLIFPTVKALEGLRGLWEACPQRQKSML